MDELMSARLAICKKCPLYKDGPFGPICDSSKFMNEAGEISYSPKEGFKRGCNCLLRQKSANPANHCIWNKW